MWFLSDKMRHHEMETKGRVLEFHTTRFNVWIPIFVSLFVFIVETYSVYYVSEEIVNWLNILRLFNTTFIPTHIATATVFLYQHFSLSNYYNNSGKIRPLDDMEIKAEYADRTMGSTIVLAFFYIIFSFKVSYANQIPLFVMQCYYMGMLWKRNIKDKVVVYKEPVRNVVSLLDEIRKE